MRLHYISFFYFNILLLFFFILKIDLVFLLLLFFRKTYSIFKESFTEYIFQEFDGLRKEGQIFDLYENKLYVDFGLDAGLEEYYIQNLYMQYALYDISLDFEAYSGNFTFKWNDNNIEELNIEKSKEINFKKIYFDLEYTSYFFFNNLKKKYISRGVDDDDYLNIYNYKGMNRRDIEDPLFIEENEKYYFNFLKIFFLKENFYDIFIKDYYISFINYNNFINNLKNKIFINRRKKKNFNIIFLKNNDLFLDFNNNITQIKKELLSNSYIDK